MDKKEVLAHTIDCKEKQLSFFDKETIEPLCKVQILENTATGDIDWGWQRRNPEEIWGIACRVLGFDGCLYCKFDETAEECKTCEGDTYSHFEAIDDLKDLKKEFIEELMKDEL